MYDVFVASYYVEICTYMYMMSIWYVKDTMVIRLIRITK